MTTYAVHVRRKQGRELTIDRTLIVEARSGAHAQGVVKQWLRRQDHEAMERPGYQRHSTTIGRPEPAKGKPDLMESDWLDTHGTPPYPMARREPRR